MKNIFFLSLLLATTLTIIAQEGPEKQEILYGKIQKDDLQKFPFSEWFDPGYRNYQSDTAISSKIKKLISNNFTLHVYLGTWCGDSRREVPRLLRLLDDVGFPENHVHIIALGGVDSLLKQSPQHEEAGKGIFRVPTVIVYKNNVEINRINEFPALSLEADLFAILDMQPYTPNYRTFPVIKDWLGNGTLLNKNISSRSLAGQLRSLADGENELNSLAHLLLSQDKKEEALRIFQVNYYLYPESSKVLASLGEGYYKTGDQKNAVSNLERALETNKDPGMVKEILAILYRAKNL